MDVCMMAATSKDDCKVAALEIKNCVDACTLMLVANVKDVYSELTVLKNQNEMKVYTMQPLVRKMRRFT